MAHESAYQGSLTWKGPGKFSFHQHDIFPRLPQTRTRKVDLDPIHLHVYQRGDPAETRALFISGIHPDERGTAQILTTMIPHRYPDFFYTLVMDPHRRAALQHNRVFSDPYTGQTYNLNRQFPGIIAPNSIDSLYQHITYPEAQLLLHLLQERPQATVLFSFHEDDERGREDEHGKRKGKISTTDGFYFYDMLFHEKNNPEFRLIHSLRENLIRLLILAGFDVFNGIDDPNDPELGLQVQRGMIQSARIARSGLRPPDSSFEGAAIELGAAGHIAIQRGFIMEIPFHLSLTRKRQLMEIILSEFVDQYLSALGILSSVDFNRLRQ